MNQPMETPSAVAAEDFSQSWRYKTGIGLIIVGHIGLFSGLLLPVLGLNTGGKAGLVGVLIIGGELLTFLSIAFLGKDGFLAIKKKIFGSFKAGYTAQVGPVRHYVGIALFFVCMLTTYLTVLYAWTAFGAATQDEPMPIIWGFDFAQQGELVIWLFLIGELSLLFSIYILGAEWWERFRDVVVWKEKALDV